MTAAAQPRMTDKSLFNSEETVGDKQLLNYGNRLVVDTKGKLADRPVASRPPWKGRGWVGLTSGWHWGVNATYKRSERPVLESVVAGALLLRRPVEAEEPVEAVVTSTDGSRILYHSTYSSARDNLNPWSTPRPIIA